MAIAGAEYRDRLSIVGGIGASVVGAAEPVFRLFQTNFAKAHALSEGLQYGQNSPQFHEALSALVKSGEHLVASPLGLALVPVVVVSELIEPNPDRNVPTLERLARYAYIAVATRAVTIALPILSNIIEHIKDHTDIGLQPEMFWIPVALFALGRGGWRIRDTVRNKFHTIQEERQEKMNAKKHEPKKTGSQPTTEQDQSVTPPSEKKPSRPSIPGEGMTDISVAVGALNRQSLSVDPLLRIAIKINEEERDGLLRDIGIIRAGGEVGLLTLEQIEKELKQTEDMLREQRSRL